MSDRPVTFALGLPHTPWIPIRGASWERLRHSLGIPAGVGGAELMTTAPRHMACFTERASNRVWPLKMWRWACETDASHFVTLQDDTIVAPCFWEALTAMVSARSGAVIGLSAVHPAGPEIARQGHRWYRTPSWLVGWAYVVPISVLRGFVAWCDANPELVASKSEDDLLGHYCTVAAIGVWHPVPTIVDHDTSIDSTYANDAHIHRRATVTWRSYAREDLADVDWWRGGGPTLANPAQGQCWGCMAQVACATFGTGMAMCRICLLRAVGAQMGVAFGPSETAR